ncbi:unnamed protein product [Ilex paraguariensis]|uniref:DUF4408 domain-containing protein n=1 Tax=Ilex paraguariensis TaxID=185542 RepID=A0ABC8UQZ2_9AQUA
MDSFGIQNVKFEKANAILRYRRRQKITTLFRFIEIFIFLVIITRFSCQFPLANFKLSGEYFRGLSVTLVSTRFVFVVGNVIIVTLFWKSGQFSAQDDTNNNIKFDFHDDYVENSQKNQNIYGTESENQGKQSRDKDCTATPDLFGSKERKIHRCQSEDFKKLHHVEPCRELRRSVTERNWESVNYSEKPVVNSHAEDEMSSEEFRRKVEAFIARQQKLLMEE